MNYNIQIIVVILKNYYDIFSMATLDYWKNYGTLGFTHAQYCVFCFGGADSIVNKDGNGL